MKLTKNDIYMNALIYGLVTLAVYLAIVMLKDGKCPPSISDSYYTSGKWMFTIVMFSESILLSIALIENSRPQFQCLGFVSGAALAFVGAAPHFKEEFEKKIHFSAAYTFAIGSQLWVCLNESPIYMLVWMVAMPFIFGYGSHRTFIEEITCVAVIALSILC